MSPGAGLLPGTGPSLALAIPERPEAPCVLAQPRRPRGLCPGSAQPCPLPSRALGLGVLHHAHLHGGYSPVPGGCGAEIPSSWQVVGWQWPWVPVATLRSSHVALTTQWLPSCGQLPATGNAWDCRIAFPSPLRTLSPQRPVLQPGLCPGHLWSGPPVSHSGLSAL